MIVLPHLVPFLRSHSWLGVGRGVVPVLNTVGVLHGSRWDTLATKTIGLAHTRVVVRVIGMMVDLNTDLGGEGLLSGLGNV